MPSKSRIKVTQSTGNVFRDLGFPAEEAEHLLIRADLLLQLQKAVAARRLTQAAVAKVLRITQPRVSDLLRGQLGAVHAANQSDQADDDDPEAGERSEGGAHAMPPGGQDVP